MSRLGRSAPLFLGVAFLLYTGFGAVSPARAQALSAGCAAHNLTQSTPILAGNSITNSNFSSTGTFNAGEEVTFSTSSGPTQPINVTLFTITETNTSTNILNATTQSSVTFTIPSNGTFFFSVFISANNPGPNSGALIFTQACVVGAAGTGTGTGGTGTTGGTTTGTTTGGTTTGSTTSTVTLNAGTVQANQQRAALQTLFASPIGIAAYFGAARAGALVGAAGNPIIGQLPVQNGQPTGPRRELAIRQIVANIQNLQATADGLIELIEDDTEYLSDIFQDRLEGTLKKEDHDRLSQERQAQLDESKERLADVEKRIVTQKNRLSDEFADQSFQNKQERDRAQKKLDDLKAEARRVGSEFADKRSEFLSEVERYEKYGRLARLITFTRSGLLKAQLVESSDIDRALELRDEMDSLAEQLEKLNAQIEEAEAELRATENEIFSIKNQVQGVIALAYQGRNTSQTAALNALNALPLGDDGVSFSSSLRQFQLASGNPASSLFSNGSFDAWVTGRYSTLSDGSSAGRDGFSGNVSIGFAKRLSDTFAVSLETIGRFGELEIEQVQSETDLAGVGFALSGVVALTEALQFSTTGFYEHAWLDANAAGAIGSYGVDRYGVIASLSGTFSFSKLVLQPDISATYSNTDADGYVDSVGTVVPGQSFDTGTFNSGLTASMAFEGDGILDTWQPYVTGRLHVDFERDNDFLVGPGIIVTDSNFNAQLGGGMMLRFNNGSTASLGASYFGLGGSGINTVNFGAQISILLN